MVRFLFLLPFFMYFQGNAQSYLGHTKEEIQLLITQTENLENSEVAYIEEGGLTYLKVTNHYETLYYYLDNGVCVMFEVIKPYSCNCLKTDYAAYANNCYPVGKLKWVSKDYATQYQMELLEDTYKVSIKRNNEAKISETDPPSYTPIVQTSN